MLLRHAKAVPWHLLVGAVYWCVSAYVFLTGGVLAVGTLSLGLAVLTLLLMVLGRHARVKRFVLLLYGALFAVMLVALLSGPS